MRGFRIGRILGIELRVDWSWLVIFVLLTWNLVEVFARWHPDWARLESFAVAACASLIFFGCVLLHELAHSVVALRYGIPVRSITLLLFGGVSNIEREPPSAKAEFFMAIVGPLTSIALGGAFLTLGSTIMPVTKVEDAMNALTRLDPLSTLIVWLGPINIAIGLFNMVPAFPLDGGRVLRSILWGVTGNLHTATRQASIGGQIIAWAFIAGGVAMAFGASLPFFGTGLISGMWLAFIGWFLNRAAAQASTRLALDDALAGMTVQQLMQRNGPTVSPELSVAALVHQHLLTGDDRTLPVVREGALIGLVSAFETRGLRPDQWDTTSVGSIMRGAGDVLVTTPEEPLVKAFEQLARRDIGQIPVVVDGALVGMLRRRDVTRWLELAWKPASGARKKPEDVSDSVPVAGAHHTI
jgi:Zn-dependent protease/CBS domain-containing protein